MVDLIALKGSVGKTVDLEFNDGHAVRAKLITVDQDDPTEIIYDIIEVLQAGPITIRAGTVASANPADLKRFVVR